MSYLVTKNVRIDYLDMITSNDSHVCAWTWNKLTDKEKQIFKKILYGTVKDFQIEDDKEYEEEWDRLDDLYSALLELVGYTGIGWREENTPKLPTFKVSYKSCKDGQHYEREELIEALSPYEAMQKLEEKCHYNYASCEILKVERIK